MTYDARDIQSTLNCTFETSAPRRDTEPVAHNQEVAARATVCSPAAGQRDVSPLDTGTRCAATGTVVNRREGH
jgi:hypothetical protein